MFWCIESKNNKTLVACVHSWMFMCVLCGSCSALKTLVNASNILFNMELLADYSSASDKAIILRSLCGVMEKTILKNKVR